MELKKENPDSIWRCKLMNKCVDKGVSERTLLAISNAIKNSDTKEELAKAIIDILEEEQDESMICQRLIALSEEKR